MTNKPMNGGSCLLGPEIATAAAATARPQLVDESGNVLLATCVGVPDDAIVGFARGCLLQRQDASNLYINKGDAASATWSSIAIP